MISNEHPDVFERLRWDPDLPRRVDLAHAWLRSADRLHVTSEAGTDLAVDLRGAFTAGSTGVTAGPGIDRPLAGWSRHRLPGIRHGQRHVGHGPW